MTYIVPSHPSPPPTPPRTALLQNLTSQSQFLLQLFTLLSSTAPLPTLPPPTPLPPSQLPHPASTSSPATSSNPISRLYSSLQTSTLELAHILDSVHAHQAAYRELDRQKLSVIGLEYQVHELVRSLETGRRELEVMVEDGKEVRKSIEKVNLNPIPVQPLLAHAQALARTSSAPVSSLLAPVDRVGTEPWPNEMGMRMGLLFRLEGSMSGIGDVGNIGHEKGEVQVPVEVEERLVHREEPGRRYDPDAVFQLELNSDESDDE